MKQILFALILALLPAALSAQVAPSDDPGLQPGDLVEITVWQRPELSGQFTVALDGTLTHPLYSQVRVTGLPPTQVEDRLRSFLSQFEANPQVVVRPLYQISVAGEVFRPDIYTVQPGTTVTQVLTMAGGVTGEADTDDAQLTRGTQVTEIDLRDVSTVQMPVRSGDQILVKADMGGFRERVLPFLQFGMTIAHFVWWGVRD